MRNKPPEIGELLNLTALIYVSVLDPSKITDSMGAMEACSGMPGPQLFTFHRDTSAILESQMCAAVHRSLSDDYLNHWGNVDPRVRTLAPIR